MCQTNYFSNVNENTHQMSVANTDYFALTVFLINYFKKKKSTTILTRSLCTDFRRKRLSRISYIYVHPVRHSTGVNFHLFKRSVALFILEMQSTCSKCCKHKLL